MPRPTEYPDMLNEACFALAARLERVFALGGPAEAASVASILRHFGETWPLRDEPQPPAPAEGLRGYWEERARQAEEQVRIRDARPAPAEGREAIRRSIMEAKAWPDPAPAESVQVSVHDGSTVAQMPPAPAEGLDGYDSLAPEEVAELRADPMMVHLYDAHRLVALLLAQPPAPAEGLPCGHCRHPDWDHSAAPADGPT